MRIAYFDCSAGAAGDMIVAAMLDAGLGLEYLKEPVSEEMAAKRLNPMSLVH